jgi:hypothetical protein
MIGAASMLSQSLFAAKPSSIKIAYSAITWGGKTSMPCRILPLWDSKEFSFVPMLMIIIKRKFRS